MASVHLSAQIRQTVAQRAQGLCEYCQSPEAYCPDSFTVDHVIPRQQGGTDDLENLAWSCFGCNGRKHTKTEAVDPKTQQPTALFNPRQQSWSDHFAWCEDLQTVTGKTSCGRATIETLALNRLSVVNLRRILMKAGEHPVQKNE